MENLLRQNLESQLNNFINHLYTKLNKLLRILLDSLLKMSIFQKHHIIFKLIVKTFCIFFVLLEYLSHIFEILDESFVMKKKLLILTT